MKILCCYVKLNPETERTVKAYAPGALFVDTSKDDYAYWNAIREHWTDDEDLIIIEQDIAISAEIIPSFARCRKPWCTYSYRGPNKRIFTRTLGCTKFSHELRRKYPMIPPEMTPPDGCISVSWQFVDSVINMGLGDGEIDPHVHGTVEHLHDYKEHPTFYEEAAGTAFSGPYVYDGPPPFKYDCELMPDGTYGISKRNTDANPLRLHESSIGNKSIFDSVQCRVRRYLGR